MMVGRLGIAAVLVGFLACGPNEAEAQFRRVYRGAWWGPGPVVAPPPYGVWGGYGGPVVAPGFGSGLYDYPYHYAPPIPGYYAPLPYGVNTSVPPFPGGFYGRRDWFGEAILENPCGCEDSMTPLRGPQGEPVPSTPGTSIYPPRRSRPSPGSMNPEASGAPRPTPAPGSAETSPTPAPPMPPTPNMPDAAPPETPASPEPGPDARLPDSSGEIAL